MSDESEERSGTGRRVRWTVSGLILLAIVVVVVVRNQPAAVTVASLSELSTELETMVARIAQSEANLAAASELDQAFFSFQRRSRWAEHHEVLRGSRRFSGTRRVPQRSVGSGPPPETRSSERSSLWKVG